MRDKLQAIIDAAERLEPALAAIQEHDRRWGARVAPLLGLEHFDRQDPRHMARLRGYLSALGWTPEVMDEMPADEFYAVVLGIADAKAPQAAGGWWSWREAVEHMRARCSWLTESAASSRLYRERNTDPSICADKQWNPSKVRDLADAMLRG